MRHEVYPSFFQHKKKGGISASLIQTRYPFHLCCDTIAALKVIITPAILQPLHHRRHQPVRRLLQILH